MLTHTHCRRLYAALAASPAFRAISCSPPCSAPALWPTRFSLRCGCRIISARSSPRAPSTPPSCRPMPHVHGEHGRRSGAAVHRPYLHAAAGQPGRAAGRCAGCSRRGDRPAGAGLLQGSRALHARGRAHPHHLSLSAAGHPRHALRRHPQRVASLRRRRRGADPAQSLDDDDAGARRVLSDRRPRRRLGRADLRRSCEFPAGRRRRRRGMACLPRFAAASSMPT